MNELLQKHGCSNVFTIPDGLKELMADITREVLRGQPAKIYDFIANYLSVLLITREHGILAVRILDDLCDCKPTICEHLHQLGLNGELVETLSNIIKEEIEGFEPIEGKEKVRELQILKRILKQTALDEDMSAKVCQVTRNAFRDYWYRKKLMQKKLKVQPDEPWEIAAQHTLEIYKTTKPSFTELSRATQKIQAAYKGYHVRRNILRHLKPKPKKSGPKVELPGPPLDVAGSREIDLGPVINIQVKEDDMSEMFDADAGEKLGLQYNTQKTITHVDSSESIKQPPTRAHSVAGNLSVMSKVISSIEEPTISQGALSEPARKSKVLSAESAHEQSSQKISFAEEPPQIIAINEKEIPVEVAEQQPVEVVEQLPTEPAEQLATEPAEEQPLEAAEEPAAPADDEANEVPEDMTDLTGEADSIAASAPSSGAVTADTTDAEEEGEEE